MFKKVFKKLRSGRKARLIVVIAILAIIAPLAVNTLLNMQANSVRADTFIKFDEGYGTTSAAHDSNNAITAGTISLATWINSDLCFDGNCLYFPETADALVYFPDNANLDFTASDSFTITFWFRHKESTGKEIFISKYGIAGYQLYMEPDGDITFAVDDDNTWTPDDYVTSTAATYDDNKWHNVAAVKIGTTSLTLYIDGIKVGEDLSISATGTLANAGMLYVGGNQGAVNYFYKGFIDEIKVYRSAKTASEIKGDYVKGSTLGETTASFGINDQSKLSDGMVGYWMMDETAVGATRTDFSGNRISLIDSNTVATASGRFGNAGEFVPASSEYLTPQTNDYFVLNASVSGPNDDGAVWSSDEQAFDDDLVTMADTTSVGEWSSNALSGAGTSAPAGGGTISSVTAYFWGASEWNSCQANVYANFRYSGSDLGTITNSYAPPADDMSMTLSAPAGGWTWNKVQNLEVYYYAKDPSSSCEPLISAIVAGAKIKVTYTPDITIKSLSFWVNPDALTNYYVNLSSTANIQSNSSGVISANGFANPKIYVNGFEGNTLTVNTWSLITITSDTAITADQFYIGRVGSNYFDGTMDEVRVYNRVLSPGEIQKLYNWAPGPVGYWKFDEGSGTTAYDSSGNGTNLTLYNNIRRTTGMFSGALRSINNNGIEEYAQSSDNNKLDFANDRDFTLGAWVKFGETENSYYLIARKSGSSPTRGYYAYAYSDEVVCSYRYDTSIDSAVYTVTTQNWGWHYVSCVMDRSGIATGTAGLHIFIDGVLKNSTTPTAIDASNTGGVKVGDNSPTYEGDATVDNVVIYNYARSPSQVIEDMNAGHPAPGSPIGSAVGEWGFDEGYGDTANNAGSGGTAFNGNLGSSTSCPQTSDSACPSWTNEGKFEKALSFSTTGTDDYVSVDGENSTMSTNNFSVSAWIYRSSDSGAGESIVENRDGASDGWAFVISSTDLIQCLYNGQSIYSITTISTGTWYHVACTSDSSRHSVYVNGKLESTGSHTGSISETTDMTIGMRSYTIPATAFPGKIDEVKVYNSTLTADHIRLLYNQGQAAVMGAISTASSSATMTSSARSYCPPGDTETCNPPIAEWKLDENKDQTFYDTSNNNLYGTLGVDTSISSNDPAWFSGYSGSALNFDGSNDYLRVADNDLLTPGGDMTISMWFKLDTLPTATGNTYMLFEKSDLTDPYQSYYCYVDDDSSDDVACRWTNSGRTESNTAAYTPSLSVNTWYHLTFIRSGTSIYVYINGKQDGYSGTNATGTILNSDLPLYFGANVPALSTFLDGQIDNVKLYNYARTPAQIAWDYNQGGPVGHWRFDEGSGDTTYNSSEFGSLSNGNLAGSGGSCPGAAACPTWTTSGKFNSALDYDSSDDYVSAGSDNSIDNFFVDGGSISAWIYLDTFGESSLGRILDKGGASSSSGPAFAVCNNVTNCTNSLLLFYGFSGSNDFWWTTPNNTISTGVWTHVVVTYTNNSVNNDPTFYINGVKRNTIEAVSSSGTANDDSSNTLYIGNRSDGDRTFDGKIDDLKIWDYVLSPEQVRTEYNAGSILKF